MKILPVVSAFLLVSSVFAQDAAPAQSLRDSRQEARQEYREEKKELRQEFQEDRKENREEFKERMKAIRDEKKLAALERIEEKLAAINSRRTEHFLKVLARLREILSKIESRSEKAAENGKDITGVTSAIGAANTAIDTAETAVNTQKEKVYEVTVNDETTARSDAGAAMKQLQEDLRKVFDVVKTARTAVHDALKALVAVAGGDTSGSTP